MQTALKALAKPPSEEDAGGDGDKVLVLISSLLAWDETPKKLQEIRDPAEVEAEQEEARLAAEEAARLEEEANKSKKDDDDARSDAESEKKFEEPPKTALKEEQPPAAEGEEPAEEGEQAPENEEEEVVEDPEPVKVEKRKKFIHHAFTETDFQMRRASAEYAAIKAAEDAVLSFKREGVKTYVISAGVLYGKGESIFNSHFKKAWLQKPARLPIVGGGKNLVPTIHVTDLARMVKKVFETKPER